MIDRAGGDINQRKTTAMKRRTKLAGAAALVLALGIGTYAYTAHSQERRHGFGPFAMHGPGMMGRGDGWAWDRA